MKHISLTYENLFKNIFLTWNCFITSLFLSEVKLTLFTVNDDDDSMMFVSFLLYSLFPASKSFMQTFTKHVLATYKHCLLAFFFKFKYSVQVYLSAIKIDFN